MFRTAAWEAQSIALWFTSPNGYLDDTEPATTLRTDPGAVQDARHQRDRRVVNPSAATHGSDCLRCWRCNFGTSGLLVQRPMI